MSTIVVEVTTPIYVAATYTVLYYVQRNILGNFLKLMCATKFCRCTSTLSCSVFTYVHFKKWDVNCPSYSIWKGAYDLV